MSADRTHEVVELLRSIDGSLKWLVAAQRATLTATGPVADDRDLDGTYGDELVRFNPRDWTGESLKGARMSACPPDALDLLAAAYDYFAERNEAMGKTRKSVV